ncbi:hypothetical protein ACMFMG_000801 [Clarireedia jacksonii]
MEVLSSFPMIVQVAGRINRIGQTKVQRVYLLWLDHSFDQIILHRIFRKIVPSLAGEGSAATSVSPTATTQKQVQMFLGMKSTHTPLHFKWSALPYTDKDAVIQEEEENFQDNPSRPIQLEYFGSYSGSLDAVEPIHRPSQPSRKSSLAGSAALSSSPPKRSKDPDSNAPRTSSIPSQDPDYESGESTPTRPCKHSRLSSKGKSHSRPRGEIHQPRSQLSSIYVQSEDDQDTPTPPLPNSYMGESFGLFLGLFFNYRSHQRTQQPASKA